MLDVACDEKFVICKAYNGHKWAIIFTDDCDRLRWVYTFKDKEQAHDKVIEFLQAVHTQYGKWVKKLRMDNGTEFGGKKLHEFLREHGIILEPTVPYTPEQGGVVERTNRTIVEKVRSVTVV
jgi:transposase InsO family protein